MADVPRLLCIMGSGETAPTMRGVHKDLFARVAGLDGPAVLLDTPYGFQENAGEITTRTTAYFGRNVGSTIELAAWRDSEDPVGVARTLERIRGARDGVLRPRLAHVRATAVARTRASRRPA